MTTNSRSNEPAETGYRTLFQCPPRGPEGYELHLLTSANDAGADTFLTLFSNLDDIVLYLGVRWDKGEIVLSRRIGGTWSEETIVKPELGGEGVRVDLKLLPAEVVVEVGGKKVSNWPLNPESGDLSHIGASGVWVHRDAPAGTSYLCMIHEGRCGSTVLASLINQHPEIVHFNEVLTRGSWISPEFVGSDWEKRRDALEIKLPDLPDYIRSLASTRSAFAKPAARRHIGFEIKMYQVMQLGCDLQTLTDSLTAALGDVKFMYLTRRNILRRQVSNLRCIYKDVSHAKNLESVNYDKVRIDSESMRDWSYDYTKRHTDLADFLETSHARQETVRQFAASRGELHLEYEDFEKNPLAGAEKVFDFLEVPRIDAKSPLLKTGDKPLSDLVENYDEVRNALQNTRWEPMLD